MQPGNLKIQKVQSHSLLLKCFPTRQIKKTCRSNLKQCGSSKMVMCLGEDNPVSPEQIQMLERMAKMTSSQQENNAIDEQTQKCSEEELRQSCYIHNLPLWRVQWAQYPGQMEILNVHVPHYVDMFNRLMESPKPWYFGHMYLPEGSKNLSNPEYELREGSSAPLIGTLMKITHALCLPKGVLLIIACGVQRFQVVRKQQSLPYQSADVKLIMDAEELQMFSVLSETLLETTSETVQQQSDTIMEMSTTWNKMYWELETYLLRNICTEAQQKPVSQQGQPVKLLNYLQDVNCLEVVPLNPSDYKDQDFISSSIKQGLLNVLHPDTPNKTDQNLEQLLSKLVMVQNSVNKQMDVYQPYLKSLLETEKEIWDALYTAKELVQKITEQEEIYPEGLTCLHNMPDEYPQIRRLQRLSYVAALALPDFDVLSPNAYGEGRQQFLETKSIADRFRLVQKRLQQVRQYIHYFID
eukprot:TRINITY_DN8499_c2_g2_i1.p1 TRINITY_DN8499_c2_g2~~TRINITY_DN8499_c2_g2_i1.p1  ORF type:complete len:467 (+),score=38.76 TRINITY_DN8499_c2_g2_i1:135-1535(+)